MTAREALRLGTRGGAAVLRRDDLGVTRARAVAPTWRSGGPTASSSAGADDPVAALVLAGPHRVDRLYVGGEEVVRDGRLLHADEDEIAREHGRQARRFSRERLRSRPTCSTPSAGKPARACGRALPGRRGLGRSRDRRRRPHRRARRRARAGRLHARASTRPRRSSAGSSSRSSSRTATTTSPSSSRPTRCASYRGS